MTIPTGGFTALLVVATFALTGCGGDDGASATTTSAAAQATATVTQTATATAPPSTTQTQATQTATKPATTEKKQSSSTTTETKAPAAGSGSGGCGPIEIGLRDGDVELTYARITAQQNVSCQTVTIVAQQWGGQRIGVDTALLPKDWECSGNSCSGPKGSFSFTLYKPE